MPGLDPVPQPLRGFDDDLRPDPRGIAHRDGKVSWRHASALSEVTKSKWRRSRQRLGPPKAPDFETTSTLSQRPPRIFEWGRPGSI